MLAWVVYANNSIFLVSLVPWGGLIPILQMKKVKKGRVQLCQPVTDIGPQQPRVPSPTERIQGVHQDAALSSSPDCEPPSPARGKNIHWAEVPAWFLKTIFLCFLFPFFFIKSSSQPNLFYAIRCWLSSRATYSVFAWRPPRAAPSVAFLPPRPWARLPYQRLSGTFHQERSRLRSGWWQWSTESHIWARLLASPGAVTISASPSKTRAQQAFTDEMNTSPQFLNSQGMYSLKCVFLQNRFKKNKIQTFIF